MEDTEVFGVLDSESCFLFSGALTSALAESFSVFSNSCNSRVPDMGPRKLSLPPSFHCSLSESLAQYSSRWLDFTV
jgi:hypothetical protein